MPMLVIDARNNDEPFKQLADDREAIRVLGDAAVSGRIWRTEQVIGAHILEKLTEAGFILWKVK